MSWKDDARICRCGFPARYTIDDSARGCPSCGSPWPECLRVPAVTERILICYRTACSNAAHPCGYNRVTHGLYCLACASEIGAAADGGPMFPLLRVKDRMTDGGSWRVGLIRVREAPHE